MKVQGKLVVVTGGLSGLGAATVERLLDLGAYVAVIDLNLPNESRDAKLISRLKYFKTDVSNPTDVTNSIAGIVSWSDNLRVDIVALVCCAGFLGPAKIISKKGSPLALETFAKVLNISLTGTIDVIRQLLPRMTRQNSGQDGERGVIITVSSAAAFDGQEGQVSYSAAKGAIASMTLPLARDLSRYGIRSVCIAPGMFETGMVAGMPSKAQESVQKSLEFPARAGRPAEFAGMVEHIIANSMLNGTVIRLDGAARMPSRL